MENVVSPLERVYMRINEYVKLKKSSILSGLFFGILAHGFMFTNKLVNADEITSLFYKGATIDSGRWGLELISYVLPNVSVPWLWGILSLVLITFASCVMLDIFEIKHPFFRFLLPAIVVTFPALTGTFCFMFTSSAYAVAFLLAVLAVFVYVKAEGYRKWIFSSLLLIFSMSIYQAYVAMTASFLVIIMIQRILDGEKAETVFLFGVKAVLMLLISLVVYYLSSALAVYISDGEFLLYAVEGQKSIKDRVAMVYYNFKYTFLGSFYGYVNSRLSYYAHILSIVLCAFVAVIKVLSTKDIKRIILVIVCVCLLPLSTYCMYLIANQYIVHSLVLYSFISVYVFAIILIDKTTCTREVFVRDIVALCIACVIASNIFLANMAYLKMHLQYENAHSYFTSLVSQIKSSDEYSDGLKIAIIGQETDFYDPEQLGMGYFTGPSKSLINAYTRNDFIKYYIGWDITYASDEETYALAQNQEYKDMPEYPNVGSIKRIDEFIVAKLG